MAYRKALVGAFCLAMGCTGQSADITDASDGIAMNGLDAQKELLWAFKNSSMTLDGPVAGSRLNTDSSAGLEQSKDGRKVLKYLAQCVMPEGTSLLLPTGEEFPGLFGVAPQWLDDQCDETCQRWTTACLLAHANGAGAHVAINLRGHPNFNPSQETLDRFTFQEAGFFGNIFDTSRTELQDGLYHCSGDGWGDDPIGALLNQNGRACGVDIGVESSDPTAPTACPGSNAGVCQIVCEEDNGLFGYAECKSILSATRYNEVITVYLEPEAE